MTFDPLVFNHSHGDGQVGAWVNTDLHMSRCLGLRVVAILKGAVCTIPVIFFVHLSFVPISLKLTY